MARDWCSTGKRDRRDQLEGSRNRCGAEDIDAYAMRSLVSPSLAHLDQSTAGVATGIALEEGRCEGSLRAGRARVSWTCAQVTPRVTADSTVAAGSCRLSGCSGIVVGWRWIVPGEGGIGEWVGRCVRSKAVELMVIRGGRWKVVFRTSLIRPAVIWTVHYQHKGLTRVSVSVHQHPPPRILLN